MKRMMKSLGPPLTMLCVVAYLCWGHLSPPDSLDPTPPRIPRLNPKRLNPEMAGQLARDPFRITRSSVDVKVNEAELAAQALAAAQAARTEKQEKLRKDVSQLVLNGAVLGTEPQAIINQRLFSVGDYVKLASSGAALRLTQVSREAAVLESDLITVKLSYGVPPETIMADASGTTEASGLWGAIKSVLPLRNVSSEGAEQEDR